MTGAEVVALKYNQVIYVAETTGVPGVDLKYFTWSAHFVTYADNPKFLMVQPGNVLVETERAFTTIQAARAYLVAQAQALVAKVQAAANTIQHRG